MKAEEKIGPLDLSFFGKPKPHYTWHNMISCTCIHT